MSATVEWSGWIVPLILGVVSLAFLRRRRDHFSDFLEGARMGAESCIRIFPSLLALVGALNVFTASGLADAIARLLTPVLTPIGIPAEIIPMQIRDYVRRNYPDAAYVSYEIDRNSYEVTLSNRLELKFNSRFALVEIDD